MDNEQRNMTEESGSPFDETASSDTIIGAALGVATALGGGYLCGLMIDQFALFRQHLVMGDWFRLRVCGEQVDAKQK